MAVPQTDKIKVGLKNWEGLAICSRGLSEVRLLCRNWHGGTEETARLSQSGYRCLNRDSNQETSQTPLEFSLSDCFIFILCTFSSDRLLLPAVE